jgi:hypothetical protein
MRILAGFGCMAGVSILLKTVAMLMMEKKPQQVCWQIRAVIDLQPSSLVTSGPIRESVTIKVAVMPIITQATLLVHLALPPPETLPWRQRL